MVELGKSLAHSGRHREAIQAFEKVTSMRAQHADAWHQMARSYEQLGEDDDALKAFDTALSFDSRDADIWNNRGVFFFKIGIEPARSDDTDNQRYGLALLREAIRCWDNSLRINPNQENARKNLDQLLRLTGPDFRELPTSGVGPPDVQGEAE